MKCTFKLFKNHILSLSPVLIFIGGFFSGLSQEVQAGALYVSTLGKDTNLGTVSSPFKTISKGLSVLKPGQTLVLRGGAYAEKITNTIPSGTNISSRTTIRNYPGEHVWLKPPAGTVQSLRFEDRKYIECDGINIDGIKTTNDAIKLAGATSYIRIKNAEIKNTPGQGILANQSTSFLEFVNLTVHDTGTNNLSHGIYLSASNSLVDSCEFYNIVGRGISNHNSYNVLQHDNIIRNNKVHNNHRSGILVRGDNCLVYNNLVYNNGDVDRQGGIAINDNGPDGNNNKVYNNKVYNNIGSGITIADGAKNTTVKDNDICGPNPLVDKGIGTIKSNNSCGGVTIVVPLPNGTQKEPATTPEIESPASPVAFGGIGILILIGLGMLLFIED